MRAFVFTDGALAKQAGRFVWLSIDTEKDRNRGFLDKYPVEVWPTMMVIDPSTEKAVLRWPGSATVPQLERLLDDGERATRAPGEGDALLARADRLAGGGRHVEAARAFREALAKTPPARRGRV